jgi:hypothetical protein
MSKNNKKSFDAKMEKAIIQAELLADSSAQKLLRSLAYSRYLRTLVTKEQNSWQYTLTHPQQSKRVRGTDFGNKKWTMQAPRQEFKHFEEGLFAECWHCNGIFQKKTFCEKCGFFICPHCNKCACQLPECCQEVARKFLRAISGQVPPFVELNK